jgi:uncharacterized protein YutE (UPF0331/DUF86 family)
MEAAIALCYHISSRSLQKVPEKYARCFRQHHEAGIIAAQLAERLQRMARPRNLLVHMYWKVDYNRVYDVLQDNLADMRALCAAVVRLV